MSLPATILALPWLLAGQALWLGSAVAASSVAASSVAASSMAASAAIPFKPETLAGEPDGWRFLGSLIVCILLLALILYLVRRYLGAGKGLLHRGGQRLQVLESRPLGSSSFLHVVRFGQREILIGQSPQGLVRLASSSEPSAELSGQMNDQMRGQMNADRPNRVQSEAVGGNHE